MQNILKGSRALVGLFLLVVALFAFWQIALAGGSVIGPLDTNVSDECQVINTPVTLTGGSLKATTPPGNLYQYGVHIDWGDGTFTDTGIGSNTEPGFFGSSGDDSGLISISDLPDAIKTHSYSTASNTFTIAVTVYHQRFEGNDGTGVATATITICIVPDEPENIAPVAADDSYTANEDTVLATSTPGVLWNDTDADKGDPLSAATTSNPTNGTLEFNPDGSFTYTPNQDYYGPDSFTYVANDGTVDSSEATVTITVNPVNDAPVALDVSDSTQENTAVTVTLEGIDVDGDSLTFSTTTSPSNGTLSILSGDQVTYTPNAGFTGDDSFQYQSEDNSSVEPANLTSEPAIVTITVNPDDTPVCEEGSHLEGEECVPDEEPTPTATLTLVKVVVNDNDGEASATEWTLSASSTDILISGSTGDDEITDATVNTGTYDLSELNGPDGYDPLGWDCGELTMDDADTITLSENDNVTCTITNDDIPAEPVDVCSNIGGVQTEVPANHTEENGICTENEEEEENNGGGGGGNGPIIPGGGGNGPIIPSGGSVLGASTQGEVLGDSCGLYMDRYLRFGSAYNDSEQVIKLQEFLNKWTGANLSVSGTFGLDSVAAVKAFQAQYSEQILAPWGINEPTGHVYITTLRQINLLECPALSLGIPSLVAWSENPNLPKESFGRAIATAVGGNTGTTETTETEEETSEITLDENTDESDQTASVANASDDDGEGFWSRIWNNLFGR